MERFQLLSSLKVILYLLLLFAPGTCVCKNVSKKSNLPSDKEILNVVMSLSALKLKGLLHCNGVGSDQSDSTVGQFLSGFWEYHMDTVGTNFIDIDCTEIPALQVVSFFKDYFNIVLKADMISKYNSIYLIDFHICRRNDNDIWCWGLRFVMNNRQIIPGTITCIGAG